MRLIDYLVIAFRNLARQKARTALTIIAVIIGAISVTVLLALVMGAQDSFKKQLEQMGVMTLITIFPNQEMAATNTIITAGNGDTRNAGKGKILNEAAIADIKTLPNVNHISPMLAAGNFTSMKLEGEKKKTWTNLTGFEPESKVFNMNLLGGRGLRDSDIDKVVLGFEAVRKFGYTEKPTELVGKKIVLNAGAWYSGWGVPEPLKPPENMDQERWDAWQEEQNKKIQEVKLEIIGVLKPGQDEQSNFINLKLARMVNTQRYWKQDEGEKKQWETERETAEKAGISFNKPYPAIKLQTDDFVAKYGYGTLVIKVDDPANVDGLTEQIKKKGYGAVSSKEVIDEMLKGFIGVGAILGLIGGVALFVAALGIINTMVMSIFERTKEIGVMRACGAARSTIRRLFLFEAALLGCWGGVLGVAASYGLVLLGDQIFKRYVSKLGAPIDDLVYFPWWLVAGVIIFTTLVGMAAGFLPALRAARLDPVIALRDE